MNRTITYISIIFNRRSKLFNVIPKLMLTFIGIHISLVSVYSQDNEGIEDLFRTEIVIENPVYMPVLSVGVGYFDFYGEVNDAYRSYSTGKPGFRISAAAFLGKKHYLKGNFFFLTGDIASTQRSVIDTSKNLNFRSNIYSFGANFQYSFKPLFQGKYLEPFISVGIETLQFASKADYYDKNGKYYHYWNDGTIHTDSQYRNPNAPATERDYVYETDLRKIDRGEFGKYGQMAFAIPVEAGFDFNVSDRVSLRVASSLHYAFTDLIDDMSPKSANDEYMGKKGNDMYTFSYLAFQIDLFSSGTTKIVEEVFANLDNFDMTMYDDLDVDGVWDGWDECPNTPEGIPVDTLGCPFDTDNDGVPDYLDREESRAGVIVDEYGVEMTDNMMDIFNTRAVRRSDVETYLLMQKAQNKTRRGTAALPIPDKFQRVDRDKDGYISFDELLKTIDDYFDSVDTYSTDDIKELNDFFFEQ